MISSIKPASSPLSTSFSGGVRRSIPTKLKFSPLKIIKNCHNQSFNSNVSHQKPLHISSASNFKREVKVEAYEADRSLPLDINIDLPNEQSAQKLKIGIYFATWWALNVVFNIYNKKVLNAFPYPWLTSTLSLACGSLMMLVSWATRIADAPKTDLDFWKTLFPVAVAHTIGHVAATVSMSKVAVSFTHIIKSGEPAFSVLVSRFFLGETFPLPVYLSLLPIIGGCALAAVTELNFNIIAYRSGLFPPSRCSMPYGNCTQGNSETEPFIAAHNTILAHAKAVQIYRTKYQKEQKGSIGIVVQTSWFEPISDSIADKKAAERAQSFYSNWILDPVVYGKYPEEMVNLLGSALPQFSSNEINSLKNYKSDFLGINHYTSYFVQDCLVTACNGGDGASRSEGFALKLDRKGNVSIGELTDVTWQHIDPEGFRKMLNYLKNRYNNIPMYITENGFGHLQKPETTVKEILHDTKRIQYLSGYLDALKAAMRDGVNVKGYFAWSLLDNYEWLYGYKVRFGLFHVDYTTLKRTPKQSASWYKNFIEQQHVNKEDHIDK